MDKAQLTMVVDGALQFARLAVMASTTDLDDFLVRLLTFIRNDPQGLRFVDAVPASSASGEQFAAAFPANDPEVKSLFERFSQSEAERDPASGERMAAIDFDKW